MKGRDTRKRVKDRRFLQMWFLSAMAAATSGSVLGREYGPAFFRGLFPGTREATGSNEKAYCEQVTPAYLDKIVREAKIIMDSNETNFVVRDTNGMPDSNCLSYDVSTKEENLGRSNNFDLEVIVRDAVSKAINWFAGSQEQKNGEFYTVVKGDTLVDIAEKTGVPYVRLRLGNPEININNLDVGQKIKLPAEAGINLQGEQGINYNALYSSIERREDLRTWRYFDTKGFPTIGIGFNLTKEGAKGRIKALGYDYDKVLKGEQEITREHACELMREDAAIAVLDAKNYIGNGWERLDAGAKEILIDMAYNMGETFGGIWSLRAELNQQDPNYAGAARRMRTYKWYTDTGDRGKELTEKMEALGGKYNSDNN